MHTRIALRSFAISSYEGSACCFVTNDLLEVCLLAQQSDVVTPIRPITGRHSLVPASSTCHPISGPYDRACLSEAECQAYRVSL